MKSDKEAIGSKQEYTKLGAGKKMVNRVQEIDVFYIVTRITFFKVQIVQLRHLCETQETP